MKIIVLGSINMDLVVTTPHLPKPGETLTGHTFFTAPGGKGANQAVAAARLGAETVMLGRVGNDSFATPLKGNLQANGVDVSHVQTDPDISSGVAFIAVDDAAENNIIIIPGANGRVDQQDVARLEALIEPNDVLLLQLEIPLETVLAAARVGAERNATVILDPAPARPLPDDLFAFADILTPNETEASLLTGVSVTDHASAKAAVKVLHQRGAQQVLLKMGSAGGLWSSGTQAQMIPSFQVEAIDTVAAGDACNGGLAAGIAAGLPVLDALKWGMASGALATTKRGAQEAMPTRPEILDLINRNSEGRA